MEAVAVSRTHNHNDNDGRERRRRTVEWFASEGDANLADDSVHGNRPPEDRQTAPPDGGGNGTAGRGMVDLLKDLRNKDDVKRLKKGASRRVQKIIKNNWATYRRKL